jgi:hypothetical protein
MTTAQLPATDPGTRLGESLNSRRILLPYAIAMTALSVVLQLAIWAAGNRIGLVSTLGTVLIAAIYAVGLVVWRRDLPKIRFGTVIFHAMTYVAVNVGFLLHGYLLIATRSPHIAGDGHLTMDAGWFGATFGMAAFWGVGLGVHLLASIFNRGFEN